jgi:hypothetical protein
MRKMTVFWDVVPRNLVEIDQSTHEYLIALTMEAVSTSETSVNVGEPETSQAYIGCVNQYILLVVR